MSRHISWLRLEHYALGELPPRERHEVEAHLQTCVRCARRWQTLADDARPMPALPGPRTAWRWPAIAGALALAAAALVWVRIPEPIAPAGFKGGEVALALVLERHGQAVPHPALYRDGDRVQALITCPPGAAAWRLVVYEGEAPGVIVGMGEVQCGNQVPLPTAFRVRGADAMEVCVELQEDVVCTSLEPAR